MSAPTVERGPATPNQTQAMVRAEPVHAQLEPFQPRDLVEARDLAKELAQATILPKHLRNAPADVYATLIYGRELGLSPMQSILGIHMIEGRPSLSAQTAVALVKRSPLCEYFVQVESTDLRAKYETMRKGDPNAIELTYTIEQATQAGLVKKTSTGADSNWLKHPAAMLRARASLQLARDVYPDIIQNVYTEDELDEIRDRVEAEKITAPPPPPPVVPKPAPTTSTAPQSNASRAGEAPARVAPRAAEGAPISVPAAARASTTGSVGSAPPPPPRAETAAGPMDDIDPNFRGDPLPPTPAPKEADARGEASDVDELVAIAGTAPTLAELAAVGMRVAALSKDDKEWLAPFWVDGLIRVLDTGPEADVERVFAEIAKYRKAKRMSAAQEAKAAAIYQARTAK